MKMKKLTEQINQLLGEAKLKVTPDVLNPIKKLLQPEFKFNKRSTTAYTTSGTLVLVFELASNPNINFSLFLIKNYDDNKWYVNSSLVTDLSKLEAPASLTKLNKELAKVEDLEYTDALNKMQPIIKKIKKTFSA